jgi:hypothetical protein
MTVHRSIWIILSLLLALLPGFAHAAPMPPNPVAVGQARFTVISPFCIRLEYNAEGRFVDQPSLFAVGRTARFDGFRLTQSGDQTVIDTGIIRLIYASNGQPFSPSNLQAVIHRGGIMAHWTPGAPNLGNLGGTLRTLDGAVGPEDLGQGLISRDGWYLLDDSRTPLLTKDWVESRPTSDGTDWYLFGYGDDYRAALRTLAVIGGPVPMPRKYALGSWYSRYWPYSSADYREIVSEYAAHDFPLDNIVLDMDWHKDGWTGWSWNRKLLPDAEQLLPWFHRQDLHDTLNLHPADGVGPQEDQYGAFMRDMGANPSSGQTIPFDAGSKKYMDTLFKDVLDPLRNDGVDFWWLDWQQDPYTRSILDLTNLFWLNTLLFDYTGEGGQRGMSFSRWGGWGDHRHPIHFSGDADTGFPMLAFEVPFTSTAGATKNLTHAGCNLARPVRSCACIPPATPRWIVAPGCTRLGRQTPCAFRSTCVIGCFHIFIPAPGRQLRRWSRWTARCTLRIQMQNQPIIRLSNTSSGMICWLRRLSRRASGQAASHTRPSGSRRAIGTTCSPGRNIGATVTPKRWSRQISQSSRCTHAAAYQFQCSHTRPAWRQRL